jgi:hypothetical protein
LCRSSQIPLFVVPEVCEHSLDSDLLGQSSTGYVCWHLSSKRNSPSGRVYAPLDPLCALSDTACRHREAVKVADTPPVHSDRAQRVRNRSSRGHGVTIFSPVEARLLVSAAYQRSVASGWSLYGHAQSHSWSRVAGCVSAKRRMLSLQEGARRPPALCARSYRRARGTAASLLSVPAGLGRVHRRSR